MIINFVLVEEVQTLDGKKKEKTPLFQIKNAKIVPKGILNYEWKRYRIIGPSENEYKFLPGGVGRELIVTCFVKEIDEDVYTEI